jgi:cytochrome b561
MALQNNTLKYGSAAKTLHWLMAIMVICMIAVGFIMDGMKPSPDKLQLIGLHKATGIVVLALVSIRLMWKWANPAPLLPHNLAAWEKLAAKSGHALLYFFMFAMPISGWGMSSGAGYPVSIYGLFTMPNLIEPNKELGKFFNDAHGIMAWGFIVMITLHMLAALMHHFVHKNNVLLRMLPYGRLKKEGYSGSDTMAGC